MTVRDAVDAAPVVPIDPVRDRAIDPAGVGKREPGGRFVVVSLCWVMRYDPSGGDRADKRPGARGRRLSDAFARHDCGGADSPGDVYGSIGSQESLFSYPPSSEDSIWRTSAHMSFPDELLIPKSVLKRRVWPRQAGFQQPG